jgi:phosphoglucomutase
MTHPLAGKPAPADQLIDPARLEREYHERSPDLSDPNQLVSFGTSGHRGNPLEGSFNEAHILAITQAICEHRKSRGITGPLFMGKDTHAASAPAERTALEVLAANGVEVVIQSGGGATPTPSISRAILRWNRGRREGLSDGIVITPSHNPPADGGFKYNPPHGGPADTDVTSWVQERANALLKGKNTEVNRLPYSSALRASATRQEDFVLPYVDELAEVLDLEPARSARLRIGVDPLGGSSAAYWAPIAERFGLNLEVVNPAIDPTFRFMTLDHDGRIRMDCSSPYAMAGLVSLKDRFDVAFGADPDADRHGIVTRSRGLLNPNHYLAASIDYLLAHRASWPSGAAVGKTLVSSGLIDRVVDGRGRKVSEVPVGFKWFASGLLDGSYCFGGEESAGASFLKKDGTVWTTDKDGILLCLLAAEITARTEKDPGVLFQELAERFGMPHYTRLDAPATPAEKDVLKKLSPESVAAKELAGEPILSKLTRAPGNGAPIGGLKVVARSGWFAARPSGTENLYKIYAESFRSEAHLGEIVEEARRIVGRALSRS